MDAHLRISSDPLQQLPTQRRGRVPHLPIKRLYPVDETAVYLSISTWQVYDLINSGELCHVRIGKRKLIDIEDLEAFVRNNKEGGNGQPG